jgi:hypothetical protein
VPRRFFSSVFFFCKEKQKHAAAGRGYAALACPRARAKASSRVRRPWARKASSRVRRGLPHRRESQPVPMAWPAIVFAEPARPAPLGGLPHDSSCGGCAERQKGLEGGCFVTGGRAAGGGPRATGRAGQARGYAALQVEGTPVCRSRVRRPARG